MMKQYALTFTVKPGCEQDAADILSGYGRPAVTTAPGRPLLLSRTTVGMSGNRVVRVLDVEGDLPQVLAHLDRNPRLRAVEEALEPYLDGLRDALDQVQDRLTPGDLLPAPGQARRQRVMLSFPVRPGRGTEAARRLARVRDLTPDVPTTVARTTIFAGADVVVWVVEVAGGAEQALDGLAAAAVRVGAAPELARFVDAAHDLTTRPGVRRLLADCTMRVLTDRRVGEPGVEVPSISR